MFLAGLIME